MLSSDEALKILGAALLRLEPTGDTGFEGLLAGVVADLTGLTFRLARSGSQFGRDASSQPGAYAISLEAKRYSADELRLESLSGKVVLASQLRVDLWLIGSTSTVGDDTLVKLRPLLEANGISVCVLDWAAHPIPPLAVALAAANADTLPPLRLQTTAQELARLTEALETIRRHPAYATQAESLRDQLSSPAVGLDSLRRATALWLNERFGNPGSSRQSFGQVIQGTSQSAPTVLRVAPLSLVETALAQTPKNPTAIVLLGEEGTGKTWLIAQWWSRCRTPPIVVFVSGRRVAHLRAGDPKGNLARLLAEQHGGGITVEAWHTRLERWGNATPNAIPRFVLVLDGINEHPGMAWADIASELAQELHRLGGTTVVSARPAYWRHEVEPRLSPVVSSATIAVDRYTDSELDIALTNAGVSPGAVSISVRDFMRNPRVCSVAVNLLRELALQPDALTVDRLLFHYWAARLRERGDLVGHSLDDFEAVLRSHAAALRDNCGSPFPEDRWVSHSGAAERKGRNAVADDFTEIVEGRFLSTSAGPVRGYEFRPYALPFALGLLVTHELWLERPADDTTADEIAKRILEPIGGFGVTSDIAAAAVALACLTARYPDAAKRALIRAWFGLQNKTDESWQSISAYFTDCPDAFLDVVEHWDSPTRYLTSDPSLVGLIIDNSHDPRVAFRIESRIGGWLARWSRKSTEFQAEPANARRQREHAARIDKALAELSADERQTFSRLAAEVPDPVVGIQRLAVLLLAQRALEPFSAQLLGWAFTQWIAPDLHDVAESLAWIVRFNAADPAAAQGSVRNLTAAREATASLRGRKILASCLRLLGDSDSARRADDLFPLPEQVTWHRRDLFCTVDPFNPFTSKPSDLAMARAAINKLDPAARWASMGRTIEEHDFDSATPALARFEPDGLIDATRAALRSAEVRAGTPLRQLAWYVLEFAPIFDDAVRKALREALRLALSTGAELAEEDRYWVVAHLFAAAAVGTPPAEQRQLLVEFPPGPLLECVLPSLSRLCVEDFETQLRADHAAGGQREVALTCLLAPSGPTSVAVDAQACLLEGVFSTDSLVEFAAAMAIERLKNDELDDGVLARVVAEPQTALGKHLELLTAHVMIRQGDMRPAGRLSCYVIGWLAKQRPELLREFAIRIDATLDLLLTPRTVSPPVGLEIETRVSDDGCNIRRSVRTADDSPRGIFDLPAGTYTAEDLAKESRKALDTSLAQARAYESALSDGEAAVLLGAPDLQSLQRLTDSDLLGAASRLRRILDEGNRPALRQVRNLGLALAAVYARHDHVLSAAVFAHLRNIHGITAISFGGEKVSLWTAALFYAPPAGRFAEWRVREFSEAFSDADIEELAVSIDHIGECVWLDTYVNQCLSSPTPAQCAKGITAAGLRAKNAHSDMVLARDWGCGFLAEVAATARKAYERAIWTVEWLSRAAQASTATDFWRFTVLAEGIADRRVFGVLRDLRDANSPWIERHGQTLRDRMATAQERRTKKRSETLFGKPKPDSDLAALLAGVTEVRSV